MDATPINLYTPTYEVELWDINGVFVADVSDIITGNLNFDMPLKDAYHDWETDRKSSRLNSSHSGESRMPSSA